MTEEALTEDLASEIAWRAEGWNDQLRAKGASGAEHAFELGCGLGLLPIVIITVLLWILGVITLIPAAVLIVMALLGLAGIATLLANIARNNSAKRVYKENVEPEIVQFLSNQHISRQLFDDTASQSLPADAPLQAFLSPLKSPRGDMESASD